MIVRVIERTGSTLRDWGEMNKTVAQSVLLYGSDSWVVTGYMLKILKEFNHPEAQRIAGMTEKWGSGRES